MRRRTQWAFLAGGLLLLGVVVGCSSGSKNLSSTNTIDNQTTPQISPTAVTLGAGEKVTFTTTRPSTGGATWSIQEDTGGWITPQGLYTAPPTPGTYHVMVKNTTYPDKNTVATVTVNPAPTSTSNIRILIVPNAVSLKTGQSFTFSTQISGTLNLGANWCIEEYNIGGSITSQGVYTAPATPGTYHVVARSVADLHQYAIAEVTVTE